MNRVIKFKAWHKILKCWFNEIALYSDGMAGMSVDAFEKQLPSKYQFTGDEVIETDEESSFRHTILTGDEWIFLERDEIELCQFTGLYDRAGKEIYEGDKTQYGLVEWAVDGWSIAGDRPLSIYKDVEVIGDKYSNPELLT